jgi:hypothetical protein
LERVIAKGESQSAQRLHIYFNAIHHLDPVFDGAMITHNAGTIRSDISTPPIMRMYSENEINNAPTIQPDTSTLRTWTVAGATHSEYYTMIARAPILLRDHGLQAFDTCATPARSRVPFFMVINAATDHLVKWVRTGAQPPSAPPPEYAGTPLRLARDADGNALGGIRLAEMEVPVARNAAVTCGLGGNHEMFETAKLNALYRNHGSYVSKVSHATNAAVKAGFLLPDDAEITKDKAAGSIIGFGLECGFLCIDEDAFPIHPSSTCCATRRRLSISSAAKTWSRPRGVTRNIATGYTQGVVRRRTKLRQGDRSLQHYCAQVRAAAAGHLVTETSALLIDQTNTLIKELRRSDPRDHNVDETPGPRGVFNPLPVEGEEVHRLRSRGRGPVATGRPPNRLTAVGSRTYHFGRCPQINAAPGCNPISSSEARPRGPKGFANVSLCSKWLYPCATISSTSLPAASSAAAKSLVCR